MSSFCLLSKNIHLVRVFYQKFVSLINNLKKPDTPSIDFSETY